MICVLALIVFSVLALFSAKYRPLAKEAFDCVFRKMTLRKCETGLDTRIKAQLTSMFHRISPKMGRAVYKRFELISWVFTILFVVSVAGVAWGGYNYWIYGNCNGPNADGFCVFDPVGAKTSTSTPEGSCPINPPDPSKLTLEGVNTSMFTTLREGKDDVLFIGCTACQYTREAYPTIMRLMDEDVTFRFAHFPVKGNTSNMTNVLLCLPQEDVRPFLDLAFTTDYSVPEALSTLGIDAQQVLACATSPQTEVAAKAYLDEVQKTGIYGTPLVFVNGNPVVGPKPYRVYRRLLS